MHMQCLKHWMQLKDLYKLAKQIKNLLNIRYTCSDWFIAIFYCSQIDNKTTNTGYITFPGTVTGEGGTVGELEHREKQSLEFTNMEKHPSMIL